MKHSADSKESRVRIGGSDFLQGAQPGGFGVKTYYLPDQQRIRMEVNFDASKQGPPGHAHGGAVTTILDEAMGAAAWYIDHPVLAVNLTVNLKASAPLNVDLVAFGWIERTEGRKVFTAAELVLPDGSVAANSTGVFVRVDALAASFDHPFKPLAPHGEGD